MKKLHLIPIILILLTSTRISAQPSGESRMMTDPSVSSGHIVFVYANDLWTAKLDGSDVMRLTANEGATVWAQPSEQARRPCLVLAPQNPKDPAAYIAQHGKPPVY